MAEPPSFSFLQNIAGHKKRYESPEPDENQDSNSTKALSKEAKEEEELVEITKKLRFDTVRKYGFRKNVNRTPAKGYGGRDDDKTGNFEVATEDDSGGEEDDDDAPTKKKRMTGAKTKKGTAKPDNADVGSEDEQKMNNAMSRKPGTKNAKKPAPGAAAPKAKKSVVPQTVGDCEGNTSDEEFFKAYDKARGKGTPKPKGGKTAGKAAPKTAAAKSVPNAGRRAAAKTAPEAGAKAPPKPRQGKGKAKEPVSDKIVISDDEPSSDDDSEDEVEAVAAASEQASTSADGTKPARKTKEEVPQPQSCALCTSLAEAGQLEQPCSILADPSAYPCSFCAVDGSPCVLEHPYTEEQVVGAKKAKADQKAKAAAEKHDKAAAAKAEAARQKQVEQIAADRALDPTQRRFAKCAPCRARGVQSICNLNRKEQTGPCSNCDNYDRECTFEQHPFPAEPTQDELDLVTQKAQRVKNKRNPPPALFPQTKGKRKRMKQAKIHEAIPGVTHPVAPGWARKKISTDFCHPIYFDVSDQLDVDHVGKGYISAEECPFHLSIAFSLVGYGKTDVMVDYPTTAILGAEQRFYYKEVPGTGGHAPPEDAPEEDCNPPVLMCGACTFARELIIACENDEILIGQPDLDAKAAGHVIRAIGGLPQADEEKRAYYGQVFDRLCADQECRDDERPWGTNTCKEVPWCSLCLAPAYFECCDTGGENVFHDGPGCGLKLCDVCAGNMLGGGKAGDDELLSLREDVQVEDALVFSILAEGGFVDMAALPQREGKKQVLKTAVILQWAKTDRAGYPDGIRADAEFLTMEGLLHKFQNAHTDAKEKRERQQHDAEEKKRYRVAEAAIAAGRERMRREARRNHIPGYGDDDIDMDDSSDEGPHHEFEKRINPPDNYDSDIVEIREFRKSSKDDPVVINSDDEEDSDGDELEIDENGAVTQRSPKRPSSVELPPYTDGIYDKRGSAPDAYITTGMAKGHMMTGGLGEVNEEAQLCTPPPEPVGQILQGQQFNEVETFQVDESSLPLSSPEHTEVGMAAPEVEMAGHSNCEAIHDQVHDQVPDQVHDSQPAAVDSAKPSENPLPSSELDRIETPAPVSTLQMAGDSNFDALNNQLQDQHPTTTKTVSAAHKLLLTTTEPECTKDRLERTKDGPAVPEPEMINTMKF